MEILSVKDSIVAEPSPPTVKKQAQRPDQPRAKKEAPPAESPKTLSKADEVNLNNLTDGINAFLKKMQYSLQFVVNKKNGEVTVKVLDENGKMIRQIPPEGLTSLSMQGEGSGMILNKILG
jgi:uncharacterized FlaG/YvyC family protein